MQRCQLRYSLLSYSRFISFPLGMPTPITYCPHTRNLHNTAYVDAHQWSQQYLAIEKSSVCVHRSQVCMQMTSEGRRKCWSIDDIHQHNQLTCAQSKCCQVMQSGCYVIVLSTCMLSIYIPCSHRSHTLCIVYSELSSICYTTAVVLRFCCALINGDITIT